MDAVRENWITGVSMLVGLFLLLMTVGIGVDDGSNTAERFFGRERWESQRLPS